MKDTRHVGAIIVKDKRILTTGYNGAPSGIVSCKERNECIRLNFKSGEHLEMCYGVHAEQNAILQAAKLGVSLEGTTMYCTHKPCSICSKMIIQSGIKKVYYKYNYEDKFADKLIEMSNLEMEKLDDRKK